MNEEKGKMSPIIMRKFLARTAIAAAVAFLSGAPIVPAGPAAAAEAGSHTPRHAEKAQEGKDKASGKTGRDARPIGKGTEKAAKKAGQSGSEVARGTGEGARKIGRSLAVIGEGAAKGVGKLGRQLEGKGGK